MPAAAKRRLRRRLWKAKRRCHYCGRSLAFGQTTLDHVVPRSHGGRSTPDNLVPCCGECNAAKASHTGPRSEWAPVYYYTALGVPIRLTAAEARAAGVAELVRPV